LEYDVNNEIVFISLFSAIHGRDVFQKFSPRKTFIHSFKIYSITKNMKNQCYIQISNNVAIKETANGPYRGFRIEQPPCNVTIFDL